MESLMGRVVHYVIPPVGRWRQEICKFDVYIKKPCLKKPKNNME
jgi:hypothetical protein